MEKELLRLSETPLHLEKTWESGGVPVLTAEVTLPRCGGKSRRARRFDRYYRQYARAYLKYCEAELLPRAAETMHTALERSAPWSCARAVLAYRVTLVRGDILSLYTEGREEHLPPRLTLRRAETWDRRTGFLLPLTAFFPPKTAVKKRLVRAARETAREQMETGTAAYYPNYGALLRLTDFVFLTHTAISSHCGCLKIMRHLSYYGLIITHLSIGVNIQQAQIYWCKYVCFVN